ncbi:MAG: hypothetical protein ACLQUY_01470 [Ktedonobacterales bacterium]
MGDLIYPLLELLVSQYPIGVEDRRSIAATLAHPGIQQLRHAIELIWIGYFRFGSG